MKLFEIEANFTEEMHEALTAWAQETVSDRKGKEEWLLMFEEDFAPYRRHHHKLWRGQIISDNQIRKIKQGQPILLNTKRHNLSSWTSDFQVAHDFAEFAGEPAVMVEKANLPVFLDFELLNEKEGPFKGPLQDPIKESEVIVKLPSKLKIYPEDVVTMFK